MTFTCLTYYSPFDNHDPYTHTFTLPAILFLPQVLLPCCFNSLLPPVLPVPYLLPTPFFPFMPALSAYHQFFLQSLPLDGGGSGMQFPSELFRGSCHA